MVEVSAVCKDFYSICSIKQLYLSKLKESHNIFFDRDWPLKSYRKTIERFHGDMYWEIINYLPVEKFQVLRRELHYRLYYSILPFRFWSHIWCCCRSQYEPSICEFCMKLVIKIKKVDKEFKKRLTIDSRKNITSVLYYGVVSGSPLPLSGHVNSGHDRQKPYSENNFDVLYYELISSPFMLWKFYLDVLGRIILN